MAVARHALAGVGRFINRHPGKIVAFFLLSLIPSVIAVSDLAVREDFRALLPDGYPAVRDLDDVTERLGGTAFTVIAIDASDLDRAKSFAMALEDKLRSMEEVIMVTGHTDVDFIWDRRMLFLTPAQLTNIRDATRKEIRKQKAKRVGFYLDLEEEEEEEESGENSGAFELGALKSQMGRDQLPVREWTIGEDGKYLFVHTLLRGETGDLEFGKEVMSKMRAAVATLLDGKRYPRDLEVRYTGSIVIRLEEHKILQRDLKLAGLAGFFFVVAIIVLYTRRLRALPLVAIPLLVGALWTLAFARFTIGSLNILTGFLVAILFGLGIDYGVHLFLRYVEERRRGRSQEEATITSVSRTGRAVLGGALTTASAFFAIQFADFKGYQEFGFLAASGVVFMLLVSLFLVPALTLVFERIQPMSVGREQEAGRGVSVPKGLRRAIMVVMPLFFLFSMISLWRGEVGFRTNWRELKGESPASDFDDYMIEQIGGSFSLTALHLPKVEDIEPAKEAVRKVQEERRGRGDQIGIRKVLSVWDLAPKDQERRAELVAEIHKELEAIPDSMLKSDEQREFLDEVRRLTLAKPFTLEEVPDSLKRRFLPERGDGVFAYFTTDYLLYDFNEIINWSEEIGAVRQTMQDRGIDGRILSENWILGTVLGIIANDGMTIVWSVFAAVFLLLAIDFRSIRHALIVMAPLVFGVISIAGVMEALSVELNVISAVVVPSIIGIGIDNAIHIYRRYLNEGAGSIPLVLRYCSTATLLASLTTMFGFGVMIIAHHKGIRSVAELAIIGISTTYMATSIFFPIALETWERFTGVGRRPSQRSSGQKAASTAA